MILYFSFFLVWSRYLSVNCVELYQSIPAIYTDSDQFGTSVAILADYAVIGQPLDDYDSHVDAGSAIIYQQNPTTSSWDAIQEIFPSFSSDRSNFGHCVSMSDNYILIGSPFMIVNTIDDAGAAFLFSPSSTQPITWSQLTYFTAPDLTPYDYFGYSVAIALPHVAIGAPEADNEVGAVYIYHSSNYSTSTKLVPADCSCDGMQYGFSISLDVISRSILVVGAPLANTYSADEGLAYLYRYADDVWSLSQELKSSTSFGGYQFGFSVIVSHNLILVGSPGAEVTVVDDESSETNVDQGEAFVFKYDESLQMYSVQAIITSDDGQEYDQFGFAVSIANLSSITDLPPYLIFSAPSADVVLTGESNVGAIYIFSHEYDQLQKIISPKEETGNFGVSLAVSSNSTSSTLLVGNPLLSNSIGEVYAFDMLSTIPDVTPSPGGSSSHDHPQLDDGATAGIVISVLLVVGGLVGFSYYWIKHEGKVVKREGREELAKSAGKNYVEMHE